MEVILVYRIGKTLTPIVERMELTRIFKEDLFHGEIVQMVFQDLHKKIKFKNILCVRTPTTGAWMDTMFSDNKELKVTRVLYKRDNRTTLNSAMKRLYKTIEYSELESTIKNLKQTFDCICVDSFHEYAESQSDFAILAKYLSSTGCILSHDCCPPKKEYSTPIFKSGWWCGETYVSFVNFAYNNPDWYYAIIDNDNGVGIMSKTSFNGLKNNFDRVKQEQLFKLRAENNENTYDYFLANAKDLINLIQRKDA